MKIGAVYPQIELGGDPQALHDIGLAVEALGYDSILFYDHVVGAALTDREPALRGPYDETHPFHDPMVAFAYLAALTTRIELSTGVLILPQRQTVLLAQQAADVDLLSHERLRLGVGTGWNWVEYDALGTDYATRGRRIGEQIDLLRTLWREPLVTYDGEFHQFDRGCINPRPRRQIPIWIGGFSEVAFRRGGVLGDGFTFAGDLDKVLAGLGRVRHHLAENGRIEEGFGTELVMVRATSTDEIVETAERWAEAGGTQVSVVTLWKGLEGTIAAHVDHLAAAKAALDVRFGTA
jgi:probable F420-dependent oxidoreductase